LRKHAIGKQFAVDQHTVTIENHQSIAHFARLPHKNRLKADLSLTCRQHGAAKSLG
jgi:hypothetical protein